MRFIEVILITFQTDPGWKHIHVLQVVHLFQIVCKHLLTLVSDSLMLVIILLLFFGICCF